MVLPASVAAFLAGDPIAVAGVSRSGKTAADAICRRFRAAGHKVVPINPNATDIEGQRCFPDVGAVPGPLHAVMIVTHPSVSAAVAQAAVERGVGHVWFHRAFGDGSVSAEAVTACRAAGVEPIVGGCPLMYVQPVDPFHRLLCWWLRRTHRVPA